MKSMSSVLVGLLLSAAASCASDRTTVGSSEDELSAAQCDYFAVNGKVQICHATGSRTKPYTILKVAEAACVNAHAGHAGDYIAVGDPSCQGGGCLPEDAPCDATLPCCDGLTCEAGTCVPTEQPPARPVLPSATTFAWQGAGEGLSASGGACGGTIAAAMGDQAQCYTAADGALMCAGRVFQSTWGPAFVDTGMRDVDQILISLSVNAVDGNAMCVKKHDGTVWCMGNANNAIFGYPPTGSSATWVQWGSANDNYRLATGTWDQLCSLHTDGRVDCTGYGFGSDYHAPTPVAGPGHHSVWVTEFGGAAIDDATTFRVSEGRSSCRVTSAGLDCRTAVYGTPGDVAGGGFTQDFGRACELDGSGRVFCAGSCEGSAYYCSFMDANSCGFFSECHLGAPTQHFSSAPVLHLTYNPYAAALCGVLNDGSLWCYGDNDRMGQGMLGTGDTANLTVDTMVAPPGSVRLPTCN